MTNTVKSTGDSLEITEYFGNAMQRKDVLEKNDFIGQGLEKQEKEETTVEQMDGIRDTSELQIFTGNRFGWRTSARNSHHGLGLIL